MSGDLRRSIQASATEHERKKPQYRNAHCGWIRRSPKPCSTIRHTQCLYLLYPRFTIIQSSYLQTVCSDWDSPHSKRDVCACGCNRCRSLLASGSLALLVVLVHSFRTTKTGERKSLELSQRQTWGRWQCLLLLQSCGANYRNRAAARPGAAPTSAAVTVLTVRESTKPHLPLLWFPLISDADGVRRREVVANPIFIASLCCVLICL